MRKIGWIVALICLCLCIPGVFLKKDIETSSQQVEFVIDFQSLFTLDKQGRTDQEQVAHMLSLFKNEGIQSVAVMFPTFALLEERQLITYKKGEELLAEWAGREERNDVDYSASYVFLNDNSIESEMDGWLFGTLSRVDKFKINGQVVYELEDYGDSYLQNLRFPLLERDEQAIIENGLMIIPHLPNSGIVSNQTLFRKSIEEWKKENTVSKVMFTVGSVLGYPNRIDDFVPYYAGVPIVYKETYSSASRQKGILELAKSSDYHIVRSHMLSGKSLMNEDYTVEVLEERVTKAVHERNNRMVYVELIESDNASKPLESWDKWTAVMAGVKENLDDNGYTFGIAKPFESHTSVWLTITKASFIVLSATLFGLLVSLYMPKIYAWISWGTAWAGLVGTQLVAPALLWTLLPFAFAILYPVTLAGFILKSWSGKCKGFLKSILLFLGISLLSVWFALALTSIYASIPYVSYTAFFKGVGLAHLIPIVVVAMMVIADEKEVSLSVLFSMLKQPIRFYHVALIGIVLAGGVFYLMRTGNGGMLLPFEAEFRSFLQETLSVRPRTKEFLLAHPLLLAILFFWKEKPWVKWFLPVAIIGQLSILNTFAHLHTPVDVSFVRSLLGIGMGLVIGCIIIGCIAFLKKVIRTSGNGR